MLFYPTCEIGHGDLLQVVIFCPRLGVLVDHLAGRISFKKLDKIWSVIITSSQVAVSGDFYCSEPCDLVISVSLVRGDEFQGLLIWLAVLLDPEKIPIEVFFQDYVRSLPFGQFAQAGPHSSEC